MTVPGYTVYGLSERLTVNGVSYVYREDVDRWVRPNTLCVDGDEGYSDYVLHGMAFDGPYRIERAS